MCGRVLTACGSRLSSWRKSCTWVGSSGVDRGRTRMCSGGESESEYGKFVVPSHAIIIDNSDQALPVHRQHHICHAIQPDTANHT